MINKKEEENIKFSIITPTYNRPESLLRCIKSVVEQDHENWELIIVNDSPDYDYSIFDSSKLINDIRVKYFINNKNRGVNYSRNFALSKVSNDSDYVIFLDDDDWLYDRSLAKANEAIVAENYPKWIIANFLVNNKNYTNKQGDLHDGEHIKYFTDYLVCKKVTGDSTHIINTKIAIKSKFSTKVKQGEEWVYFISLPKDIIYKCINIKGGKDYSNDGLNANSVKRYKSNTFILFKETKNVKMFIWLIIRLFKI